MKTAEISNTNLAPAGAVIQPQPQTEKMVLKKTGGHAVEPETNASTPGEQPKKNPQAKVMHPHVDVTASDLPPVIHEKTAQIMALPGRYPLDDYSQVKTASGYFDEWYKHFSPSERHDFAVNMVKRANALGIEVSDVARKYGSEKYASLAEVQYGIDSRKTVVDDTFKAVLDKIAGLHLNLDPKTYAMLLEEFDKEAGITHLYDTDVPDPYFSTYGFSKAAEFSETIGNLTVTEMDLQYLAHKKLALVKSVFTETLAEEFRKDPIGTYKKSPIEQRKILGNMAREQRAGAPGSG